MAVVAACAMVSLLIACAGESAETLIVGAKKKIELNQTNAAVIQLKNALQKKPGSAEARFLLGKLMFDIGDFVGAVVELQKAREFGYDLNEVTPLLARAQLAQGLAEKVIAIYGVVVLPKAASQAALQTVIAAGYLELGKHSDAKAALARALAIQPDHIPAQLLHVSMLAEANDLATATASLDEVLARAPQNSQAWQIKGDIAMFRGDLAEARRDYQAAVERNKLNLAAHSSGIWLSLGTKDLVAAEKQLAAMRSVATQNPQTRLFSALVALEKGDIKAAYEQSLQLLKIAPNNVKILHLIGAIELRRNSLIQAEANLTKALQLDPEQSKVRSLLAQTLLRAGEPAKAIKILAPLLSESSPSWEAYSLMAEALMQKGEALQAETYFSKAAKLNPQDSRSRTALAMAEVSRGRIEQGFEALRSISAVDTGPTADLALVNALLVKKDYEQALKALDTLEGKLPSSPLAAYMRGQVELQRGRRDHARVAFDSALKIDPSYFPAAANLAAMESEDGKPNLAPRHFERVLAADPQNVRANMGLIALRVKAGAKPDELISALSKVIKINPGEAAPRTVLVRLHLDRNDLKAATSAAQDGVTVNPENMELLDLLGQVQFASGDYNQAVSSYNKLVVLQPSSYEPYLRLADLFMAQKDTSAAVQNLKKALNLKADLYAAQRSLMLIDLAAGRFKEALATAKTVQAQRSSDAIGYMLEGDVHVYQRNWMAAASSYRSGLEQGASTELVVKLQNVLLADKKTAEARKLESDWLKSHADDSVYLYYLGDLDIARGDYESAQRRYEAVVRLKPDNAAALNNLAWVLNKNNKKGALQFALKAITFAPRHPAYLDTLADIYAAEGQFAKAIEAQRASLVIAPDLHQHRLHLARLYLVSGDKDQARKELLALRSLGEKFAAQAEVNELLGKV